MRTKKAMRVSFLFMALLGLILAMPTLAQAGRGHHGHGHHHGHRHHGHHHHGHHHHHIGSGYGYIYGQPRSYYRPYYPQPRSYNYNYYPAPVYGLPPQMMMGIGSGNMDFMIRF